MARPAYTPMVPSTSSTKGSGRLDGIIWLCFQMKGTGNAKTNAMMAKGRQRRSARRKGISRAKCSHANRTIGNTTAEVLARQASTAKAQAAIVERVVRRSRSAASKVANISSSASTSLRPTTHATDSTASGCNPTSKIAIRAGRTPTVLRRRK